MKVKPKKNVEIPPDIRSFTERVLNTPYERLAEALNGFSWKYDKGDFHHWIPLFNYFDTFFEKHIRSRADLTLETARGECDPPFPYHVTITVLKVTTRILENCTNKHFYQSYEHLTELLAAPESEVVVWALQALVAFLRKTHHSTVRFHGYPALNSRLFDLCKGWGGKEQGLDMTACALEDTHPIQGYIQHGTTLHFEFYSEKHESDQGVGLKVIHLDNLHQLHLTDHQVLAKLVEEHAVPQTARFRLLTRLRVVSNFAKLEGRRNLVKIRLLAFCVLIQSNPLHEEMLSFFSSEPEFMTELVELLQTDEGIPLELRTLSVRALTVQLVDRSRHNAVINAVGVGGQSLLAVLLQDSIECICPGDRPNAKKPKYNASFVEALLVLVGTLISSSSGNVNLNEAGFIPALLPLIHDRTPSHVTLVCSAVKILEGFMDYSSTASALFRGMSGLSAMITRLEAEVHAPVSDEGPSSSNQGTKRKKSNDEPVKQHVSYVRRLLMKSLLRAIALASYAPTVGTASRLEEADARALYGCLKAIFVRAKDFGGALFAFAATVATDLIHNDPLCFGALDEAGVPDAFLNAVYEGVLPSSEAVCSIPNALVALCLNANGLQKVKDRRALVCLTEIFTSKQYIKALSGDTASILGAGVDELFRHVPSLKDDGVQHVIVQMLKLLCLLGGDPDVTQELTAPPQDAESTAPEIPSEVLERSKQPGLDATLPDCLSHAAKMLEALLSNSDTSRRFAQHGGVELLLKFYTLPKLPSSFVSSSQSNPLLSIFRSLTHNNCPSLHVSVPAALAEQLERSIACAEKLGDVCIPTLDAESREPYIRVAASTSGLTAVAGTIARTSTPMLTEMCKGDKTLISTLGHLERRVLHQLSLADAWKEHKIRVQKEAEDAAREASPTIGVGEESEAERTDTEADAMEIESEDLLPEIARPLAAPETEPQQVNGAKYLHQKKAPDDLAYDVLQHLVTTARSLYTSIAKANHTPARRRDESFGRPSMGMKAAALGLAMVLKNNLDYEIPDLYDSVMQRYMKHLTRLIEEVQLVLFDNRRHCCHTLILNYFFSVKGFASLVKRFEGVVQLLWSTIEDVSMQAGPSTSEPLSDSEKKSAVEGLVLSFLNLFSQLTNPRLLCQSSQTASLLIVPLPSAEEPEGSADEATSEQAESFVKNLQESVLEAVLPVWSNPLFAKSSPSVTGSIIGILNSCLDGSGTLSAAFRAIRSDGRFGMGRNAAPDPNMIQQIIDMGFERARAVQALRRIGQNSVELALEWLVSHPDEPLPENPDGGAAGPQEQEFAEAMAASLDQMQRPEEAASSSRLPSSSIHVLDLVTGAVSVLEKSPVSAFSISTFIMTLCNRNEGADRETVIQWFIATLNKTVIADADFTEITSRMNAVAHLLALMMAESVPCREMAIEVCMIPALLRTLDQWEALYKPPNEIPMWIEGLLLVLDFLSQTQRRKEEDSSDDSASNSSGEEMAEERERPPLERILGKWSPAGSIQEEQRFHLVEFCIKLLKHVSSYGKEWTPPESTTTGSHSLGSADPAGVTQATIQLLASITRCHQTALKFLHKDGLELLLTLPASCVLPHHESYISSILKHILEDDATLQSLMESEIKNVFSTQRRPLGQLPIYDWEQMPVRNFLQKMSLLAYRSPSVFSKAVSNLCVLVQANGSQVICLRKPKANAKTTTPNEKSASESSKKGSKRVVLLSFVEVIDKLLEHVMGFDLTASSMMTARDQEMDTSKSAPDLEARLATPADLPETSSLEQITDLIMNGHGRQGEQRSNVTSSEHPLLGNGVSRQTLMLHRDVILQIMVLNMLSEFCLMYSSTVGVLLKRDAELAQKDAPAVTEMHSSLLKRVLHEHLSWNITSQGSAQGVKLSLAEEASRFLQAVCIRSSEGRRRILTEIVGILNWATHLNPQAAKQTEVDMPFISIIGAPSGAKIKALIDLIGSLLVAGSATKAPGQGANRQTPPTTGLTIELIRSMRHAGVVPSLIQALELVDMDHPEASKAIYSIIKPLEILTRSIPTVPKKTPPVQQEPPATPAPPQAEEEARLSTGDAFVVSSSPPAPPEDLPSDLMDEDLHEMEDAARMYYDALSEIVEGTLEDPMQSNEDDAMEEDEDEDEDEEDSDSNSESSSGTPSFHEDTSHENHVVVDEESEELENGHEELEASEDEALDEEDEEDEIDEGDDEDDASADMELDDGEDWEEDVAIREYTEALDRIESVVRGAEERVDLFNARILTQGDGMSSNLRSVLGSMIGNFLGPGEENRQDRRGGIRYRLQPRDRGANANPAFVFQSIPPAQHRLLTRPQNPGNVNEEGISTRVIPDAFGRRFGQLPPGDGRWRQFAYQGLPTNLRNLHGGEMSDDGYYFVTADRIGGRHGGGFGMSGAFDGERHGADAALQNSRTAGTNWMHSMQGYFERLLTETLPREQPPVQPTTSEPTAQPATSAPMVEGDAPPVPPQEEPAPSTDPQPNAEPVPETDNREEGSSPPHVAERDVMMDEGNVDEEPVQEAQPEAPVDVMEEDTAAVPPEPESGDVNGIPPEGNQAQPSTSQEEPPAENSQQENGEEDALPAEIVAQAERAGIDSTFLQALPRPLQLEVLTEHGVSIASLTPGDPSSEGQEANAEENQGASAAAEGGVDPEFLAALPPDIREEVIESQRAAERRRDMERRLTEGQGDEVANMIASLPDDIREEVLLYGTPDILANLPPNLLAEGQHMRERRIRYDIGDGPLASNLFFRRLRQDAGLGREGRSHGRKEKKEELEAPAAIDFQGLTSLVELLKMNAPVIKTQLQKLFLNLCVRDDCRRHITQLLVQRLRDADLETARNAPSITRRVLDLLAYLARHQSSKVAEMLLDIRVITSPAMQDQYGKLPVQHASTQPRGLEILLEMLGQPLCLRSVSTLEQDLQLLEVVLQSATEQKKESEERERQTTEDTPAASSSQTQDNLASLQHLSTEQLTLLPSIVGRVGLSDRAYKSAASVIKLMVEAAPAHQIFLLTALKSQIDEQAETACVFLNEIAVQGMNRALTHSLGMTGTLVLRILHTVQSLVDVKPSGEKETVVQVLSGIAKALEQMWSDLSPVIAEIESHIKNSSSMAIDASASARVLPSGASQTLPFIESFFVLCTVQSHLVSGEDTEAESPALRRFAERHRVLLNAFLRQTPALLEGSFKSLIHSPRLIDFDNKRLHFRSKIRPDDRVHYGTVRINVRREHVFEDSFYQLRRRSADALRCKLSVQFTGEEGIDAGGVSREWYQVMAREIFNANLALFIAVPDGASTFQPNPNSIIQNDRGVNHLDFFRFVGRLVGKAVYDGQLIDAHFTRSFYKHMLNQPLTYQDLEAVDLDFYKQMKWILDNDITDILMGQTFAAEMDFFGRKQIVELKEDGSKIPITESNKREYVNLMTQHKMTTAIRDQIKAFQEGFWELVPKDLVAIFNDHELELIISGLPEVDVADIKANTDYTGPSYFDSDGMPQWQRNALGYTAASQVIQWFWSVVEEFDAENLALLLQFVTGTSKVPLEGFEHLQGISGPQKFQIHKSYAAEDRLPSAHTCFNQLDLPEYKSREQLKDRLLLAIHEGREGFGFG